MNEKQAVELRKRIEEYAQSMVADSWKGAGDPLDYQSLVDGLEESKMKLEEFIQSLINQ